MTDYWFRAGDTPAAANRLIRPAMKTVLIEQIHKPKTTIIIMSIEQKLSKGTLLFVSGLTFILAVVFAILAFSDPNGIKFFGNLILSVFGIIISAYIVRKTLTKEDVAEVVSEEVEKKTAPIKEDTSQLLERSERIEQLLSPPKSFEEITAAIGKSPEEIGDAVLDKIRNGEKALKEERYLEAEEIYKILTGLFPDVVELRFNLALSLQRQKKLDEAIKEYRQSIKKKPDNILVLNNLGIALSDNGQLDEAIASFREALRIDPDDADAHYNLGIALFQNGQLDESIVSYREALRVDPDDADAHYNLGIALSDNSQLDESIASYREALRIHPDFYSAHYNLGNILKDMGQWEEAIASYREACRLRPDDYRYHYNLARASAQKSKVTEAIHHFKRFLELAPPEAKPQISQARQYIKEHGGEE